MAKKKSLKFKIIALSCFIVTFVGLVVFLFSGENFNVLKEIFSANSTKESIQESISKLGFRAYVVVGLISMMQVLLTFVPAEPLHVVAGISFGLWKGLLVCLAGILIGNTIIYILNKIFGKKLTEYFDTQIDVDLKTASASKKIALIVIILYCLPAIPYGIICFFAASMNMKFPKYILITGIGSIPSLVLDVGLGHITMATSWAVSIVVFVAIIVLLILMYRYKAQIFKKVNKYIKTRQEKEKNKVGNYNPIIYWLFGSVLYWFVRRKVKVNLKNNVGKIKQPSIILCNHGSFYDFIYSGKLLRKVKPHFIVARLYFQNKKLNYLLRGTGAFPKSMFSSDLENSKNCLKVMASKQVLALMPEARLSTVGKFEGIQDSTYKFIQKMNVPVYTIKIEGSYLALPKWGDTIRKGAVVNATLDVLFKSGEVSNLSLEELKERVVKALDYNEFEWLKNNPQIHYKHKTLAKGLENILCVCPKCHKKYTLKTKNHEIMCENCSLHATINNRYELSGVEFDNIADWYEWQTQIFKHEIEENPNFKLKSKVELRHLSKDGKHLTRHAGEGVCVLNNDGLLYKGTQDGKKIEKFFPLENIYRILFGAGEDFEIYEGQELYYFVPENKRSCVAWYLVSCLLKNYN